jgi:hypothetical protein
MCLGEITKSVCALFCHNLITGYVYIIITQSDVQLRAYRVQGVQGMLKYSNNDDNNVFWLCRSSDTRRMVASHAAADRAGSGIIDTYKCHMLSIRTHSVHVYVVSIYAMPHLMNRHAAVVIWGVVTN